MEYFHWAAWAGCLAVLPPAPARLLISQTRETGKSPWFLSNNWKHQCYQHSSLTKSKTQQLLRIKLTPPQPKPGHTFMPLILSWCTMEIAEIATVSKGWNFTSLWVLSNRKYVHILSHMSCLCYSCNHSHMLEKPLNTSKGRKHSGWISCNKFNQQIVLLLLYSSPARKISISASSILKECDPVFVCVCTCAFAEAKRDKRATSGNNDT